MRAPCALIVAAALVAACVPAVTRASTRSQTAVTCRVSNAITMNPAPLVDNGLTAPYPGIIAELAAVPVPDGAFIDSQEVTDQSGAVPTADSLTDETWQIVYKGRPNAEHSFGLVPFADPWGVEIKVTGTSVNPHATAVTWHWTVTYELKDATSCPTGGSGPKPTQVGKASASAPSAPTTPTVSVQPGSGGAITLDLKGLPDHFTLDAPTGYTFGSLEGKDGLTCTDDGGSAQCTAPPGLAVDSVVADLKPEPAGTVTATTKGSTVDLKASPPATAVAAPKPLASVTNNLELTIKFLGTETDKLHTEDQVKALRRLAEIFPPGSIEADLTAAADETASALGNAEVGDEREAYTHREAAISDAQKALAAIQALGNEGVVGQIEALKIAIHAIGSYGGSPSPDDADEILNALAAAYPSDSAVHADLADAVVHAGHFADLVREEGYTRDADEERTQAAAKANAALAAMQALAG